MDLRNKRVTVIGLSDSGFSAAKLLKAQQAKVQISELQDNSEVRKKLDFLGELVYEIGAHTKRFILNSDLIVVSPGVRSDAEPLGWAFDEKIPVISELELGYIHCAAPIVAVTGTNGKSSTASLIHHIFKKNHINSFLLGNIGRPICEDVLKISPKSVVVLEVSSFQLEAIKKFKPRISVFLNLACDHLDRYIDMDEYRKVKLRIFENQDVSDYAILGYDNPAMRGLAGIINPRIFYFSMNEKVTGSYIEGDRLFINLGEEPEEICRKSDITLGGLHNIKNVLAASLAVKIFMKDADIRLAVRQFAGLKYRFELIAKINGVSFINDSKSTTVDSALMALASVSGRRVILIAGGKDKGIDYSPLVSQVNKVKHFILIGEARKKIWDTVKGWGIPVTEASSIQDAVSLSRDIARQEDIVLLSPMCSSFDMFKDYKERGEAFRCAVMHMREYAGS